MAYLDNTSSQISAQNVGIKISQPGINAITASPTQLIFDSSWPSLYVLFQGTLTIPAAATGSQKIFHNLNYPPFVRIWVLDSNNNPIENQFYYASNFAIDSQYVYLNPTVALTSAVNVYVECYNIDLSVDVDYPTLPYVSGLTGYDNNYGIKIAKTNKSATSKNPRDFILHSRYRSPLVKAVKTESTISPKNLNNPSNRNTVQYTNQDGIATWNYGFIHKGTNSLLSSTYPIGSYVYAPFYQQSYPITITDGITTYLSYFNNNYTYSDSGATLVILRDPLLSNNIVGATY